MSKKSKIIICLLAVAVILFSIIQFVVIPVNKTKQAEYVQNQTDALTHDITSIEAFQSPYIGDANNTGNLFWSLPLNNVSMKFEIDSEACTLTVNYLETVLNIGEEKVQRDLIYNSVAAMAAIDNLTGITYNFSDDSYSFSRKQIEEIFGSPLSELLEQERWSKEVQGKLNSTDFIMQFFD
ncbi:MAG: DUF4825 domain-containing protein [Ruminococcus sp.]|nr:DUF4825 domain-containing protein [Ruminococcus sp.]